MGGCDFYQTAGTRPSTVQLRLVEMAGEHAQMRDLQRTVKGLTQALNNVIQAGARNGAGDLYENFQRMNPPKFNGIPDPDAAENWVSRVMTLHTSNENGLE
ncbi:hypothetical protein Taro_047228 [Colocasia esculenta]|uniref:Uncharacterized protein n=1 Tax=Colocasia esculenta TaxID=4460 RepID=A0A843WVN5_COLES|nr:hypothetical protein [Colocasia esculenta]